MTDSKAVAIVLTSEHESPISVPPWSALQPPNDGMTSPPIARNEAMSDMYRPEPTVSVFTPSQASVQDVLLVVSRNASVRYRAPDCWAIVVRLSVVHVSKYGA